MAQLQKFRFLLLYIKKGKCFFNTFRSVVVNIQSNTANNLMPLEKMHVWVKSICRDVHILISEWSKAFLVLIWWLLYQNPLFFQRLMLGYISFTWNWRFLIPDSDSIFLSVIFVTMSWFTSAPFSPWRCCTGILAFNITTKKHGKDY